MVFVLDRFPYSVRDVFVLHETFSYNLYQLIGFNILGPLTNPGTPSRQLLGVYDEYLVEPLAQVLMNAGTALYIGGKAESMKEGIAFAAELIDSGKALETLNKLIEVSNRPEVEE